MKAETRIVWRVVFGIVILWALCVVVMKAQPYDGEKDVKLNLKTFARIGGPATPADNPPPGYYGSAAYCVPCSTISPYVISINPSTGETVYLRYDAGITLLQPTRPDGSYGGQGGSMHTYQYYLDGFLAPLRSGFDYPCPTGAQCDAPWAPFKDAQIPNSPKTICQKYVELNGPESKLPCPSNLSHPAYGIKIKQTKEWLGAWPAVAQLRQQQCSNLPSPTRTPSPVVTTPTKTPTPGPNPYAKHIEALARAGITAGCGAGNFCPTDTITREQLAVWFVNALHLPLLPCEVPPRFNDVACAP